MYNTLIINAKLIDGTGNPWRYADVALDGAQIAAIAPPGQIEAANAADVVDGSGLVVCPGFIDIQSHSILPLMLDNRSLSKIMQGVTTEIMGEAWTPAPVGGGFLDPLAQSFSGGEDYGEWPARMKEWSRFAHWFDAMMEEGVSPNIGSYLGGGTLRAYGMGMKMGAPTADELATMQRVMAEAMDDGAFGVSYALIYPPDTYTETDELVEICRVVSRYGGSYITHVRSESAQLNEGIAEAIEIGRRANLPVEIYHLKASGRANWHKMPAVIKQIDAARSAGIDVTADMYPYIASGTGLTVVLPTWVAADGKLFENLRDPTIRQRIHEEAGSSDRSPHDVMPVGLNLPQHQAYVGKRLDEIAEMRQQHWLDAAMDLIVAENQRVGTIFFSMSEENLHLQLQQPWIKIASDAGGLDPQWATVQGPTHPRAYGTFPRVLGHYARERSVLSLEEAVGKMTSAVADRLQLAKRGRLQEGYFADVVLFDPQTIRDNATFTDSHRLSTGVRYVWVNGMRVLAEGAHTGATPGQVVRPG